MADFIELTEYKGEKVLVNTSHIVKVVPEDSGSCIFFDVAMDNNRSCYLAYLHVEESYTSLKRKLE